MYLTLHWTTHNSANTVAIARNIASKEIPMLVGMLMRLIYFYYVEVHKLSIVSCVISLRVPLTLKALLLEMEACNFEARH